MITANGFYNQTIGNLYDMDGVPVGDIYQCADYFKKATSEVLGKTWPAGGDGYVDNFWYNRSAHSDDFDFVQYPDYKNGDFVVWAHSSRDAGTPFSLSHIAMYWNGNMVGMNQNGHKEVTELQVPDRVWENSLGAFRFKAWRSDYQINQGVMRGIDISSHNDLNSVDVSKYDYVIIRAAWGTNRDTRAEQWRKKCEEARVPYGAYVYSYALDTTGAREEAEFLLDIIKDWNIQCGIWYDMEDADGYKAKYGALNSLVCSTVCQTFCQIIQDAGYYVGIYSSQSWFGSYILDCDQWDKWVAAWGTNDGTIQRDTSSMGTMLQYTSAESLDKDISYVALPHYRSYPSSSESEPVVAPEPTPAPSQEPTPEPAPSQEEETKPEVNPDYLFKMSDKTYDFLKFVTNVIIPLLITFYSSIYEVLPGGPNPLTVSKVFAAFIIFMNQLLSYSTAGYKKNGG